MKKMLVMLALFGLANAFAARRIPLSLDVAQFKGPDKSNYLEIYYSISKHAPQYQQNDKGSFECSVLLSLHIYQSDTLWASKAWQLSHSLVDTAAVATEDQMVDLIRYPISADLPYRIKLYAKDMISASLDSIDMEVKGEDFNRSGLLLSDIELATQIQRFDSTCLDAFHKRVYCVVPNPEITFGDKADTLFFYFESYNLTSSIGMGRYHVQARILDTAGKMIPDLAIIDEYKQVRQDMSREVGQIPLRILPNGFYTIEYSVSDSAGLTIAKKAKAFLMRNTIAAEYAAVTGPSTARREQYLDQLNEKMLDSEMEKLAAIAKKQDRELYRNLKGEPGKRQFLYQLYASIRPADFGGLPQDFRNHFMQRVAYVNETYKSGQKAGWKTDRGRIYMRYGKPSDIERHPSSIENNPYEIWKYENIENGVLFVFVDRTGFNFELIHSTKRGELYDPSWERFLAPAARSDFKL